MATMTQGKMHVMDDAGPRLRVALAAVDEVGGPLGAVRAIWFGSAPRALAVAMLGPHHGAPSPRARCQGGLPRNPQRRPSLTTDEKASYRPPEVDCAHFADVQVAPVLGI